MNFPNCSRYLSPVVWNLLVPQTWSKASLIGVKGALLMAEDAGLDGGGDIVFDLSCSPHSCMLPTGPPTIVMAC